LDLLKSSPGSPEIREHTLAIQKSVEYLVALSRRLRSYLPGAGRGDTSIEPVDLNAWGRDIEEFCGTILPIGVTFRCDVPPMMPLLAVNKAALTQAVYNLVQNAGKAITKHHVGSRVTLRAEHINDQIAIIVEDDGPGMPPELLKRCLEQSFTTGASDGSLGLGLSLVRGFVESAGGVLEAHSPVLIDASAAGQKAGNGTRFTLRLPLTPSDEKDADVHDVTVHTMKRSGDGAASRST
jgi:signal transduction histidine kinase